VTWLDFEDQRSRLKQAVEVLKASTSMLGRRRPSSSFVWVCSSLCRKSCLVDMKPWGPINKKKIIGKILSYKVKIFIDFYV